MNSQVKGVTSNQQIVVNNYYYESGYEYASRINRFHNSYVAFDFYSPLYTETFWYHYTPYTWGVSIYDDWYYYGGGVSRYNWTSGFGGSYWWGYDPWWDYDPWMGYGWNSWYAPGMSYGVNYYLGRPYYHYPTAWNSWSYSNWNASGPYDRYDNHNYHKGRMTGTTITVTIIIITRVIIHRNLTITATGKGIRSPHGEVPDLSRLPRVQPQGRHLVLQPAQLLAQ